MGRRDYALKPGADDAASAAPVGAGSPRRSLVPRRRTWERDPLNFVLAKIPN